VRSTVLGSATARAPGDEIGPPGADHDCRRHARQHPLARPGEVRLGADETGLVRETRPGVEVAHLVVEESRAGTTIFDP